MIQVSQTHTFGCQTTSMNYGAGFINAIPNRRLKIIATIGLFWLRAITTPLTGAIDLTVAIAHGTIACSKGVGLRNAFGVARVKFLSATYALWPLAKLVLIAYAVKYIGILGLARLLNVEEHIHEIRRLPFTFANFLNEFRYHLELRLILIGILLSWMYLGMQFMNGLAVLLMRIHEITQEADHHHTIDLDTNRIAMLKQNNKAFLDDNSILFMQLLPVNTYLAQNVDELKRMNERAFAIAKKVDKLSRFIRAQNSEASGFFSGLFGYSCQTHLDTRAFDTQRQTLRNRVRDLSTQGKNMIEYWARVEACHPQIKAPSKKSQDLHAYERLKKMVSLGVITPTDLLTIADDVNFNKFLDNKLNPEAKALSELVEWTRENCHN